MQAIDIKKIALESILVQANAIRDIVPFINQDFEKAIEVLHNAKGRIVVSGIGKSAVIAQKMVATLNSTGSPSIYLHAADAIHGDIGMLLPSDVAIIISKSGESPEIKILADIIRKFGNCLIAISGNEASYLVQQANYFINTFVSQEACPNNLAPTTSTTAQLVMADAIAICLLQLKGFTEADFARLHPGGALGKQLYLRVMDLCEKNPKPSVLLTDNLQTIIISISTNRLGATAVLDAHQQVQGIITDGDLRRMLEKNMDFQGVIASEIMTKEPKNIEQSALATEALAAMRAAHISQLVVLHNNKFQGFVHLQDLLREGIM